MIAHVSAIWHWWLQTYLHWEPRVFEESMERIPQEPVWLFKGRDKDNKQRILGDRPSPINIKSLKCYKRSRKLSFQVKCILGKKKYKDERNVDQKTPPHSKRWSLAMKEVMEHHMETKWLSKMRPTVEEAHQKWLHDYQMWRHEP